MQARRLLPISFSIAILCMMQARTPIALADDWSGTYTGGGEVSVDHRTNHATIKRDGVETQLWDGVHELDDGSSLTVHAGQAVPTREIIDSRRQPAQPEVNQRPPAEVWTGVPIFGLSPCEKLVKRVCGSDFACAGNEACSMSRQLLNLEKQERAASRMPDLMTTSSGDCLEAETDDIYFASCTR